MSMSALLKEKEGSYLESSQGGERFLKGGSKEDAQTPKRFISSSVLR